MGATFLKERIEAARPDNQPDDKPYAFKDLALLQAFSNVMLTSFSAVSNRWAGGDFVSWTIFCAFYLAATSDTTRSILYGTATATSPMQDGLLSVSSIAQMTGVPRETVRRKCVELAEKGAITREGSRLYRCVIPQDITTEMLAKVDSIIQLNERLTQN